MAHIGTSTSLAKRKAYGSETSVSYVARTDPAVIERVQVAAPHIVALAFATVDASGAGRNLLPSPAELALDLRDNDIRHVLVRSDAMSTPEILHELLDGMDGWERFADPDQGVDWWYETVIR